jgi:glutathione S-transferase
VHLKLFEHPLSPYARKVKIVLYEKGIDFERISITPMTLREGDPARAEFASASPRLEVPCLLDGEFCCSDSTIIVDYIDEKWPDPPMLPKASQARARARMIEELCDTQIEAINWGLMEIRVFRRAEGTLAEQMTARAGRQLAAVWDRLESELERSKGAGERLWFSGERFGRADASLIVHAVASGFSGFGPGEGHLRLRDWIARCVEVEGVKRDQADLAAFVAGDGIRAMRKAPKIKRQYRDHRLEWMLKTGGFEIVQRGLENETIHFVQWP